jgi:hypothetical protein
MKVDDYRFASKCQRLAHTKRLDPNLEATPRASSRFTNNRIGGHTSRTHPNEIHTVARATLHFCPALSVISNTMSDIEILRQHTRFKSYLLRSPAREDWLCCFNQPGSKMCEFIFRDRPGVLEPV